MKKIAIIGLGYVGLPLAVQFGKSRDVVGFDLDKIRINELQSHQDRTNECSEDELRAAKYLTFTDSKKDILDADIYIVTVPTPINNLNRPDLSTLRKASQLVGSCISKGDIVVYESTVYPGVTEEICVPILEQESGLKYNTGFYCGYSPERVNPGDKVNTLTTITKIVSGSTEAISSELADLYAEIIEAGIWQTSSIKVAEAAKVIENSQRDLNIAFVNELSMIFRKMHIDTLEILEAAGTKWNFLPFRPGLVGGHCIGVDPYYLTHKAEELGHEAQIVLSGRKVNDRMANYVAVQIIKELIQRGNDLKASNIHVLGITFKDNCPDTRNSKVVDLINELKSWNVKVTVSDPWANTKDVQDNYGIDLISWDDVQNVAAVVVAVGHNQFRSISPDTLKEKFASNKPFVADLKGTFSKQILIENGFDVYRL